MLPQRPCWPLKGGLLGQTLLLVFIIWPALVAHGSTGFLDARVTVSTSPPNNNCRDRLGMVLGNQISVPYATLAQVTNQYTPCNGGRTWPGIWFTIRGDGTPFKATLCAGQNSTMSKRDGSFPRSLVAVHADNNCRSGFPCGFTCSLLECVAFSEGIAPSVCQEMATWNTEKDREYIIYVAIEPFPELLPPPGLNEKLHMRIDGVGCDGLNTGNVRDPCGECSGFGYSCGYRGCDGIVGSPLRLDKCGVCGGNNSCASGCDGKPNSTLIYDVCGECGGDGKSCMGCDMVPEKDPSKRKVYDLCGVCGGNNSACADCDGVCSLGPNLPDICGVCGGNGTSCLDCAGCPFGTAKVDDCNKCNGDNSSCYICGTKDFSVVKDICGVCGGNGSSCAGECDGIPYSKFDACGVCNGDNSSCTCQFYEDFSLPEMDCRLLQFSMKNIAKEIGELLASLHEIRGSLETSELGAFNRIVVGEIVELNEFIDFCADEYGYAMTRFLDQLSLPKGRRVHIR